MTTTVVPDMAQSERVVDCVTPRASMVSANVQDAGPACRASLEPRFGSKGSELSAEAHVDGGGEAFSPNLIASMGTTATSMADTVGSACSFAFAAVTPQKQREHADCKISRVHC